MSKKRQAIVLVADGEFKRPAARKRKRKKVLCEEDYVEALEKIITRDFYPDLPKIRTQHEVWTSRMFGGNV